MKEISILVFLSILLFSTSCSNDNTAGDSLIVLEEKVNTDPSVENINNLFKSINEQIVQNKGNKDALGGVYEKAIQYAQKHRPDMVNAFLTGYIKDGPASGSKLMDNTYRLANNLKNSGKTDAGNVMLSLLAERFSNFEKSDEILKELNGLNAGEIIDSLAQARLTNPDQFGINKASSYNYVDACEAYALANPEDPRSPELLFDAAEMAKLLKTNNKALYIYDWLIEKYPNYKKTPSALFIKAFILENEMKNIELARGAYELFLEKYPNNDFADDARFSLENLGKSPDEVLKAIEANAQ